ncbi:MAG: DUF2303 family protein [Beijerinckiaceae bacterium]
MTDKPESPEAEEGFELPSIHMQLPSHIPVVMSGEGVSQMLEAARDHVEQAALVTFEAVADPATGEEVVVANKPNGDFAKLPRDFFDDVNERPRYRRGTATMTALDSLIAHIKRFGDGDSAVFADDNRSSPKLTAILDYHRADHKAVDEDGQALVVHGDYRFGKHRSIFNFPLSDEWRAWNGASGAVMSMVDFAAFLEKRIGDIAIAGDEFPEDVERFLATRGGPSMIADYAKLVELSRGLKVHEDSVVEETNVLSSGEGHIRFTSEHRTKNAAGDSVKVPTLFFIAIPVFNRGAFYRIAAALNYRKTSAGVKFWFNLHRPDRSFDHAFNEAVEKVDTETSATIFFGSPE